MADVGIFLRTMAIAALMTVCTAGQALSFPVTVMDDRGKEITLAEKPRRIVSMAPTHTELLFLLGLEKEVTGVTSYCTYPEQAKQKKRIGGFAEFDIEKIMAADPDLVLSLGTIQLPAVKELEKRGKKVFWIYPRTVNGILASFEQVGRLTGKEQEARQIRKSAEKRIKAIRTASGDNDGKRSSIYRVMGVNPPATIGAESFQSDVFFLAGGRNAFADVKKDFFEVDPRDLIKRDPDVIVICGDDEKAARRKLSGDPTYAALTAVKNGSVLVIPCDLTCRPGPRVVELIERLALGVHSDGRKQ
jgi:iron complex transport system substrate-binding protein